MTDEQQFIIEKMKIAWELVQTRKYSSIDQNLAELRKAYRHIDYTIQNPVSDQDTPTQNHSP